jgi:DNA-binding response OmpR family regulator
MTPAELHQRELAKLREQLEDARAENAMLRDLMSDNRLNFPPEWRLQPAERRVLACILKSANGFVTRELLFHACTNDEDADIKTVDVRMCGVRKKLRQKLPGVKIKVEWGQGFSISAADKAILEQALREYEQRRTAPLMPRAQREEAAHVAH